MKNFDVVAVALIIIGALNLGPADVFHGDLAAAAFGTKFGETSTASSVVYASLGLAGLDHGLGFKAIRHRWLESNPARA